MKKFTLLAAGDNFRYQGQDYSKTGPLTATNLASGQSRMIPRHAMVETNAGSSSEETAPPAPSMLDGNRVHEAFEHYHGGCQEWLRLAEGELSPETGGRIRAALELARRRFLAELKLPE